MHRKAKAPGCHKLKIYRNPITFLLFTGTKTRKRRQISVAYRMYLIRQAFLSYKTIPSNKLCSGRKDKPSMQDEEVCVWNQGKDWKVKCRIIRRACYYIDVCNTVENCFSKHFMNTIYCCQYECL